MLFDFGGKQLIYSDHLRVPVRVLDVNTKKSLALKGKKPSMNDNLIIHGDNLHALKALMPLYAGRVNCIYIDPPYNTGNKDWIFNDNVNSHPKIKEWLKNKNPVDGEDMERHDKWLCMMWPRLQLLHELLAEDGVIFISIDDNEQHHLRMIIDEIFGEENFISTIIKQTKIGGGSDTTHIVKEHEYIIVYAKNKKTLPEMYIKHNENYLKRYKEEDKNGKFFWDNFSRPGLRQPLNYDIIAPDGTRINGDWIRSKERFKQDIKSGEVKFEKKSNGKWTVLFKQRLNTKGKKPRSMSKQLGGTIEGKNEIREIFNDDRVFAYPKSSQMVKYLLESINSSNAIILDSFAGSGTTAHAALDLNKEDGGNRKFILIQCEEYDKKTNKQIDITDKITAERVRRLIKGISKTKDKKLKKGLGGSFTYCTLGEEINVEKMLTGAALPSYETLARYATYTATGGQSPDKIRKERGEDGFFYETENRLFYLIYKPDLNFLQSSKSALNSERAERIAKQVKKKKKKAIVYASHKFIGQKELTQMGIVFCSLPYGVLK